MFMTYVQGVSCRNIVLLYVQMNLPPTLCTNEVAEGSNLARTSCESNPYMLFVCCIALFSSEQADAVGEGAARAVVSW